VGYIIFYNQLIQQLLTYPSTRTWVRETKTRRGRALTSRKDLQVNFAFSGRSKTYQRITYFTYYQIQPLIMCLILITDYRRRIGLGQAHHQGARQINEALTYI
jgi:hypothetical protein